MRSVADEDHIAHEVPYRLTVRDGKKIGEHNGAHFYTIGQRKGLGIALGQRAFITDIDIKSNDITLSLAAKETEK